MRVGVRVRVGVGVRVWVRVRVRVRVRVWRSLGRPRVPPSRRGCLKGSRLSSQ